MRVARQRSDIRRNELRGERTPPHDKEGIRLTVPNRAMRVPVCFLRQLLRSAGAGRL
jgi:hypothetical protein